MTETYREIINGGFTEIVDAIAPIPVGFYKNFSRYSLDFFYEGMQNCLKGVEKAKIRINPILATELKGVKAHQSEAVKAALAKSAHLGYSVVENYGEAGSPLDLSYLTESIKYMANRLGCEEDHCRRILGRLFDLLTSDRRTGPDTSVKFN